MNTLTPRTDKAVQESNGQWSFVMRNLCIEMECELAKAQEENKKLITDMILHERMSSQFQDERDTLAGALDYIAHCGLSARHLSDYAKEALAAVKGGES